MPQAHLPGGRRDRADHELAAEPLAKRVLLHERFKFADDLGVSAQGQIGFDALAQTDEA